MKIEKSQEEEEAGRKCFDEMIWTSTCLVVHMQDQLFDARCSLESQ